MSPGWVGCQPSSSRVSALEAGASSPMKPPSQVKCSAASSGAIDDDRELEVPSDDLRDVADRNALLGDRVQRRSRRGLFEPETEEARRIQPMHGGPAVAAVADVAGDALLAGDTDQGRDEAVVPVAVIRRGKPHDRRADALGGERERELGGFPPGLRTAAESGHGRVGTMPVLLGRHVPRCEPEESRRRSTSGRSEPASASPNVSTARRSASAAPWKSPENASSCLNARWITPSEAAAALRRLSRSSSVPRCTSAPAAVRASAEASERASPTASWPAPMSSETTAEPIQPDAPVTNTRMRKPPGGRPS